VFTGKKRRIGERRTRARMWEQRPNATGRPEKKGGKRGKRILYVGRTQA